MTALRFDQVSLHVNGKALFAPLTLEVAPGETLCLLGPSGSGKSSLLAFACGFLAPEMQADGRVLIGDDDLTHVQAQDRRLGLLFQDALLFPHLSVAANVAFGLAARAKDRRRAIDDALAQMGLEGFGPRDPATLSGGQRARVALLRVLLSEPRALLLDEPFSALDPDTRSNVRDLVKQQTAERGLPTVLVTHDRDDVDQLGGQVVELTAPAVPREPH